MKNNQSTHSYIAHQLHLWRYSVSIVIAVLIATTTWADQKPVSSENMANQLVAAAQARTKVRVRYDSTYRSIDYPNGDVPDHLGVCTDVVIRAYRALGIDLQQLVHEDMKRQFSLYPNRWGMKKPDTNIDHRRVPNLEKFFQTHGTSQPLKLVSSFQPGDIVSWRLPNGAPHIGIVDSARSSDKKRPLVIHNVGFGPTSEDALFRYQVVGHFRFFPTRLSF